jgi:hypothetical protein
VNPDPTSATSSDADLASILRRYVSLIDEDDSVGLVFLRDLRETLADMYAVMVKLPAEGISPSSGMRWQPDPAEDPAFARLLERLPAALYWSALRPLTWETVGDQGVRDLAGPLIDVVRTSRDLWETAKADLEKSMSVLPHVAAFEFEDVGRPILEALTILQEVVTDLDAYKKSDEADEKYYLIHGSEQQPRIADS